MRLVHRNLKGGSDTDMGGVVGLLQTIKFWNKIIKGEELFTGD